MTALYYLAAYLWASKVITDLRAFENESSRWVDLYAFGLVGSFLVALSFLFLGGS